VVISPTVTVIRNTIYIMLPPIIDLRATAIILTKPMHFYCLVFFNEMARTPCAFGAGFFTTFFYITVAAFPIGAKLSLNFL